MLTTGGLGFNGSNLARKLAECRNEVIVVDSLIPKYGKNLRNLHNFHDFETHYETDYRKILIGWNLFIGVRVMVLPGVKIGENAIIGAQSVVTKDVPANDIFAGNPARKIGV